MDIQVFHVDTIRINKTGSYSPNGSRYEVAKIEIHAGGTCQEITLFGDDNETIDIEREKNED